jgi:2-iminobutanoate/2-iminopropanoate deaminase
MAGQQSRVVIHTEQAPRAVGPYSQAIRLESLLFTAGQVGINPASGQIEGQDVASQTRQVLSNLRAVLEAAGSGLEHIVKTTVFLTDMAHFAEMNEVYSGFFPEEPPARSTVAVVGLPVGALVEIECVAHIPG